MCLVVELRLLGEPCSDLVSAIPGRRRAAIHRRDAAGFSLRWLGTSSHHSIGHAAHQRRLRAGGYAICANFTRSVRTRHHQRRLQAAAARSADTPLRTWHHQRKVAAAWSARLPTVMGRVAECPFLNRNWVNIHASLTGIIHSLVRM